MMKRKIVSATLTVLFFLAILSSMFTNTTQADASVITIWLSSDAHIGYNNGFDYFYDSINDTNSLGGVDYAFHVGDAIQGLGAPDMDSDWETQWNAYYDAMDNCTCTYYNLSIGNHEKDDWDAPPIYFRGDTSHYGNYTYDVGNIRFIMVGGWNPTDSSYSTQRPWVASEVSDAISNSKNVIILSHYAIYDTTHNSSQATHYFSDYNNWIPFIDGNVSAFLHGHKHIGHHASNAFVTKHNCFHMNVGCQSRHGGFESETESRYFYFTDGSKTVTVKSYNHDDNNWQPAFETTFDLKFDFLAPESSPPSNSFEDINEQTNFTELTTGYRWGNATQYDSLDFVSDDNAGEFLSLEYYNWQIANDSDFTDVFVDETGINSSYSGTYSQDDTNNTWYAYLDYLITTHGVEYHRYRARVKVVTR
jgi:hypothetical protein